MKRFFSWLAIAALVLAGFFVSSPTHRTLAEEESYEGSYESYESYETYPPQESTYEASYESGYESYGQEGSYESSYEGGYTQQLSCNIFPFYTSNNYIGLDFYASCHDWGCHLVNSGAHLDWGDGGPGEGIGGWGGSSAALGHTYGSSGHYTIQGDCWFDVYNKPPEEGGYVIRSEFHSDSVGFDASVAQNAQCVNGQDDDSDGLTDYPDDPGCSDANDDDESNDLGTPQCNDNVDNDSDGFTDYPNDPGCNSPTDNNEFNVFACGDNVDNDSDGFTDLADPGCSGPNDDSEGGEPAASVDIQCNTSQGPCTVAYGGTVTLSWSSSNADSCSASGGWSGSKATSGSETSPAVNGTTVFTLTCNGSGGSGQDSVTAQNPPNTPPVTSSVSIVEPDYCTSGPAATASWTYSDADGNPQSAYQVQIDDSASFGSPVLDSGKIQSQSTSYAIGQSLLQFNTRYYARVRTWDSGDSPSGWTEMTVCTGPPGNPSGCAADQRSWKTPKHAYPGSVDFTWTPTTPQINQVVSFSKATTTCYDDSNNPIACPTYIWDFGGGLPPLTLNGNYPNPQHTYNAQGSYQVTYRAKDGDGYQCPAATPLTKTINVQKPIPNWKEVLPQ